MIPFHIVVYLALNAFHHAAWWYQSVTCEVSVLNIIFHSLSLYFTLTDAHVAAPYGPNSDVCFIVVGCCVPNQRPQITKALNESTVLLHPLHSV